MSRNFYLLEKIEKIDALLLRINILLTQLKDCSGSWPLRIVDMWIGKPPAP